MPLSLIRAGLLWTLVLSAVPLVTRAFAQEPAPVECRVQPPDAAPSEAVRQACSKLIESGTLKGGELADAYALRSSESYRLRDKGAARSDAEQALALDPRNKRALLIRGDVRADDRDYDGAMADFGSAIEVDPGYWLAYLSRGIARSEIGEYGAALPDVDKAISLDPRTSNVLTSNALNTRAWALFNLGRYEDGMPDAEKAVELDPKNASAFDTRGSIREKLGRREAAIEDYRKALALDPKLSETRANLQRLGVEP